MWEHVLVNYKAGDEVVSMENPYKVLGICTGFTHDNTCILIDGKCWGGKVYFEKSELVDYELID